MYKELEALISRGAYPFHMPGHKRNPAFFPPDLFRFDVTELPETDVLSAPAGMIKNLQQRVADFYGADESFLLTNGSSAGVAAAICATGSANADTGFSPASVFLPRNAHVSAVNGLVLSGAMPTWFMPEIFREGICADLAGGVSPKNFDNMPRGATALVVSPTYEGFVSDIATIAQKVHERDGILIVDEAHGAHFAFHDFFPTHALACGADIVINSFHKTLPMLSGCAVVHVKGRRADVSRLRFFINAMQTTSPSFLMMAQCDFAFEKLRAEPEWFEEYVRRLRRVRKEFRQAAASGRFSRASICERAIFHSLGTHGIFDIDESKLLFHTNANAAEISEILARDGGVQFEMAAGNHLLAMTSPADTEEGFSRLQKALAGTENEAAPPESGFAGNSENRQGRTIADSRDRSERSQNRTLAAPFDAPPEIIMSPREAMMLPSEEVPAEAAIGRISAEIIAEYPPGIALLVPGEKIKQPAGRKTVRVVKT
ncbi:MAG: aminotransferase class I/II-fold pyridoxal phosphate-dependent enzyme [Defluviitaleaceae bacterium]|nr:aminotransferase class I/II-fold pyridoxal phosphate-dependent enzyme [Defluviitaleaceae bacterium]